MIAIGSSPNQIPSNGHLGKLAYMDKAESSLASFSTPLNTSNLTVSFTVPRDAFYAVFAKSSATVQRVNTETSQVSMSVTTRLTSGVTTLDSHSNSTSVPALSTRTRDTTLNYAKVMRLAKDTILTLSISGIYDSVTLRAGTFSVYEVMS